MDITTTHNFEKAIVKILNLDGWNLEWCGGKYEHYDTKGLTPKQQQCVIEINGKINQYASVDKVATENLNRPMEQQLPQKEESIALAVALKEASNLVTSDIWQKCNSLKKEDDIIAAKDKILKETVTVAGLMYKVLITKPQNNE